MTDTDKHPFQRLLAGFGVAVGLPASVAALLYLVMIFVGPTVAGILAHIVAFAFVALIFVALFACITADF